MGIGTWILLGVLVACCAVPMLMMGRRGKSGTGESNTKSNGDRPSGR